VRIAVLEALLPEVSCSAMLAMYRAGYIHRDLSVGNIILLPRKSDQTGYYEDVGVLIDLEYTKNFPDDAGQARDVRTVRLHLPS
jgi:Fungal protein kinase